MHLEPGTRLGPYEVRARIGAGGMGEVYRAFDPRLERTVAIKTVNEQFSGRFEREARAVAALNHSHICQLYDIGPNYLVMEYIEGAPLEGPLPVDQAVKYATQICDALAAAHAKGITHRDLKPANILLTKTGIKLLDFGLAHVGPQPGDTQLGNTKTMELTLAGTIVGTVAYMSPEQAEGKPVDTRSDIFSFGAVLYELLTGRRAFLGDSPLAVMAAILTRDPDPLDAAIPSSLRDIVARCLRKSASARFQTALEIRAALDAISPTEKPRLRPSIAVLPFANMSRDPDNEYFSDGLSEEIINALSRIPGLKVIARTSAFAFRGKEQDVRKIAEALNVRNILEGSVRRAGNRIRVTTQLIGPEDGSHLWAERYDREMADIFALQDDIAQSVAEALRVHLTEAKPSPRLYTPNLEAYEALLKAWHHLAHYTPVSMAKAGEFLERAIALDPGYATAHSALAIYLGVLPVVGIRSAHDATPPARAAARKAVEIDPSQPDALAILGWFAAVYDFDWNEAERLFQSALACNPAPPAVRWTAAHYRVARGQGTEAIREIDLALEADPLNIAYRRSRVYCLLSAGREAEAAGQCRGNVEFDESEYWSYILLSMTQSRSGQMDEALKSARKAYSIAPWFSQAVATLAAALMRAGDNAEAEALLSKLQDGETYGVPAARMSYHLICGETALAADWAMKAIDQRDPAITSYFTFPYARPLRESPYWPELARKANFPD